MNKCLVGVITLESDILDNIPGIPGTVYLVYYYRQYTEYLYVRYECTPGTAVVQSWQRLCVRGDITVGSKISACAKAKGNKGQIIYDNLNFRIM